MFSLAHIHIYHILSLLIFASICVPHIVISYYVIYCCTWLTNKLYYYYYYKSLEYYCLSLSYKDYYEDKDFVESIYDNIPCVYHLTR